MRAALSQVEVVRPRGLDHALDLLSEPADRRPTPLAGGTDLFVYLNAGDESRGRFLDLSPLRGLRGIRVVGGTVTIGALATFREIREHAVIRRRLPALSAAAAEVGGWQIQNRATLAGNIANASPAGDSLPVLLALDAVVRVASKRGVRDLPIHRVFTGYRKLAFDPDELIVSIAIPFPSAGTVTFFRKVGTRRAQSISKVVFCGSIAFGRGRGRSGGTPHHVQLAYGSMAAVPLRAEAAEGVLLEGPPSAERARAARLALAEDLTPIDDVRSDRDYRMDVAGNVLDQFLRNASPGYTRS
ncbi:MAG TPA: FAD binding domain-containing protein [Candidatus Udaeobacter sp.]|jgi:CO/xanthine dehydrogenase FAD-binding subunit|nr:FAD binding domain-containing protein [Candidatus Udaeobacter sp.]